VFAPVLVARYASADSKAGEYEIRPYVTISGGALKGEGGGGQAGDGGLQKKAEPRKNGLCLTCEGWLQLTA